MVQTQDPPSPSIPGSPDNLLPYCSLLARSPLTTTSPIPCGCISRCQQDPLSSFLSVFSKPTSIPLGHPLNFRITPYQATQSHHTFLRFRDGSRNQETEHLPKKTRASINTYNHNHPNLTCLDTSAKAPTLTVKTTYLHQNPRTLLQ